MNHRSLVRALVTDGAIVGGAALLSIGAWSLSRPAGLMVAGGIMLAAGLSSARRAGKK